MTTQMLNMIIILCLCPPIVIATFATYRNRRYIRHVESQLERLGDAHNNFVTEVGKHINELCKSHNKLVTTLMRNADADAIETLGKCALVSDDAQDELIERIDKMVADIREKLAKTSFDGEVEVIMPEDMPEELKKILRKAEKECNDEPTKH